MEEAVVYPGKLPIVSDGNSLWERVPQERGSTQCEKLTAELLAQQWLLCIHWDLVLGVRWPPPGIGRDDKIETTKGKKEETGKKGERGHTMDERRRQTQRGENLKTFNCLGGSQQECGRPLAFPLLAKLCASTASVPIRPPQHPRKGSHNPEGFPMIGAPHKASLETDGKPQGSSRKVGKVRLLACICM
ncbi:hypothetical protein EXN66_Car007873 [Channa argus]|uniref:Uncharacterized protein n=1 Tax=Channa argus TaxID=215402 RepID=A0A6G1PPQ4_CHAAH|nr:hypothetical protein EXN66_Car007873 [Channa argus]